MEVYDPDETDLSSEDEGGLVSSARRDSTQPSLAGDILAAFSQVRFSSRNAGVFEGGVGVRTGTGGNV